jgi:hypothetical protein
MIPAGSSLMSMVPGEPEGYLHTASSLQELGRRAEALQTRLSAVGRFRHSSVFGSRVENGEPVALEKRP